MEKDQDYKDIDDHFNNITPEQLKKNLKDCGLGVIRNNPDGKRVLPSQIDRCIRAKDMISIIENCDTIKS